MRRQVRLFWFVTAGAIAWMFVMRPFTPSDIVAFELARTSDQALRMIAEWGTSGVEKARMSIYLDFVFLVLYSWAISLGCRVASDFSKQNLLIRTGTLLAKLIWVAALCDVIENVAMLMTLQQVSETTLTIAFWSALLKFTLVLISLVFILLATGVGLGKKLVKK